MAAATFAGLTPGGVDSSRTSSDSLKSGQAPRAIATTTRTHERIKNPPASQQNHSSAHDDSQRYPRIAQHMPEGATDIEVILGTMLKQERDRQVGGKTDQGDQHDPFTGNRNRSHDPFDTHERDADCGENQDE